MQMKCVRCGSPISKDDRACMKCGAINYYNPENEEFIRKYGNKKEMQETFFDKKAPLSKKRWPAIVITILIILILIYILI